MSLGLGEGLLKVLMLHIEKQPALSLVAEAQLVRQMVGSVALVMVGVVLGNLDKALKGLEVGGRIPAEGRQQGNSLQRRSLSSGLSLESA